MQECLSVLDGPGVLDELGVGQIRDVFSDRFFPGTSTLWRRARYLLFVPWGYRELELRGLNGRSGESVSRTQQARLIRALKQGGDVNGLIGVRVNLPAVMPDSIIWNGLFVWGIRTVDGSVSSYWRQLESGNRARFSVTRSEAHELIDTSSASWWHPRLPSPPEGLLDETDFELRPEEATFLNDQLQELHERSMTARALGDDPLVLSAEHVWEEEELIGRLDQEDQLAVEFAHAFSFAVKGSQLMYRLLLAEAREHATEEDEFVSKLEAWTSGVGDSRGRELLVNWPKRSDQFWVMVRKGNPNINDRTVTFIDTWIELSTKGRPDFFADRATRELIKDREWALKRGLAKLSNKKALDSVGTGMGTGGLDYRWGQAKQVIADIADGLGADGVDS